MKRNILNDSKVLRYSCKDEKQPPLPPLCKDEKPTSSLEKEEPPPCPPPPPPVGPAPCPPTCVVVPDPRNPCNYEAPECPPPGEPDMTKVKKMQCIIQCSRYPMYLARGRSDAYLFNALVVFGIVCFANTCYCMFKIMGV